MSSQPVDIAYDDLDTRLTALGAQLDWTATPDFASAVLASTALPLPMPAAPRRHRWLAAAAIALLLIGGLLAASSSVRTSVADFLGIDGLRIEIGEPETTPVTHPNLGTPTSMQDFERWLPFTPMQPATLGSPDAVYLRVLENGDMLGIMAWQSSDTLPEAAETGLGALLMEFDPPEDIVMLLKTVAMPNGRVTETTVNGSRAYWVQGASDLTIFGADATDTRATANALIWQQDGVGFRLESALSMDDAIAIAETMEPIKHSK